MVHVRPASASPRARSVGPSNPPLVTTTLAIMDSPYVAAGSSFGISGTGFLPARQLQAFLFSTPMFLGTGVSDVNGNYRALFNIPLDTPAGPHTVVVQGPGPAGPNESVATIVVTAPGTQPVAGSSGGYGTVSAAGGAVMPTTALASTPVAAATGQIAFTGSNVHGPLLAGSLLLVIGLYLSLAGHLREDLLGRGAS